MNDETINTFKDILKRIFNCINEYIDINIKNPILVESKLISINNYVIDILHIEDLSPNSTINNNINQKPQNNTLITHIISSRELDEKKKTIDKYKKKFFDNFKERNDTNVDNNYDNSNTNSQMKTKYKTIKLKSKIKNDDNYNKRKELSYIQRLSFIQNRLISSLKKKKGENQKQRNNNSFSSITINNSCYMKRNMRHMSNNRLKLHNSKHSVSQYKIENKNLINDSNGNSIQDLKLKYELLIKKNNMKKNNIIKFDFNEIKKNLEKRMYKIKGYNIC